MDGKVKIRGLEDTIKAMKAAFPSEPEAQRRLVNATMRRSASQTFVKDAKSRAMALGGSGALADSIGMRTMPRGQIISSGKIAGVYIAPLRHKPSAIRRYIGHYFQSSAPGSVIVNGIRYGHLVEFGHVARDGSHVAARPFMGPAIDSQFNAYRTRFAADLGKKVEAAVRRKAKK